MSILVRIMYASRRRPIDNAQHTWVCEHLSEVCDAPLQIKINAESCAAGQRSYWTSDGVLKPLLINYLTIILFDQSNGGPCATTQQKAPFVDHSSIAINHAGRLRIDNAGQD